MQQTQASGGNQSVYVRTSSVAPLNLELNTENRITGKDDFYGPSSSSRPRSGLWIILNRFL
eukprot:1524834-Pyramimonas_sp.AAC.1